MRWWMMALRVLPHDERRQQSSKDGQDNGAAVFVT
jgi:hypothetical protein